MARGLFIPRAVPPDVLLTPLDASRIFQQQNVAQHWWLLIHSGNLWGCPGFSEAWLICFPVLLCRVAGGVTQRASHSPHSAMLTVCIDQRVCWVGRDPQASQSPSPDPAQDSPRIMCLWVLSKCFLNSEAWCWISEHTHTSVLLHLQGRYQPPALNFYLFLLSSFGKGGGEVGRNQYLILQPSAEWEEMSKSVPVRCTC